MVGKSRCVYCCDVIFAIRLKRKNEERKEVYNCVAEGEIYIFLSRDQSVGPKYQDYSDSNKL